MTLDKEFLKKTIADAATSAGVSQEQVYESVLDGLMKAHEFIGHVTDTVANRIATFGVDIQDVLMDFSETVEDMAGFSDPKATFAEPGTPVQDDTPASIGTAADEVNVPLSNVLQADVYRKLRSNYIGYIASGLGLDSDTVDKTWDDDTIYRAYQILRQYKEDK
jgi:hypothetical protein